MDRSPTPPETRPQDPGQPPATPWGDTVSIGPGIAPDVPGEPVVLPPQVGPYAVERELGRGGMGAVYLARDTRLDREVALKVVGRDADDAHREMMDRFRHEAQAAGRLADHPNVVGVYDVGETETLLYLAMDLVRGVTLDALVADGDLSFPRAAELVEQAARAAHHAHTHGVLHRDIKPGNVMVEDGPTGRGTGEARLADFGLARTHGGPELTRLTQTGTVLGTPAYMPPEQAQGEGCDARSDVYALGATLYHALVGAAPFEGETLVGLLLQVVEGELVPPRRKNPAIPRALDAVVCKAMAREPADRYRTAAAFADDLARYRRGEAVLARPGASVRGLWRWSARHPVAAGLLTAAVVAGGLGGAWWLRAGREAGRQQQDALQHASAASDAAERAGRVSRAYYQLSLGTRDALATLEDRWHGVPVPPAAVETALARVREAAAAVAGPDVGVGDAWLGLALAYAGRADEGNALVSQAQAHAPHDPFPHVIAARLAFAAYTVGIGTNKVSYGSDRVSVTPHVETPDQERLRQAAADALAEALAENRWAGVEHGREQRRFGLGASLLARRDYAGAAAALEKLCDDALLGGDAAMLLAAARTFESKFDEAATVLEPLVQRGWTDAMQRSVTSLLAMGIQRYGRGEDATPWYDRTIQMCDLLIARRPGDPNALDGRALARSFLGRAQRARGVDPTPVLELARDDMDQLVAQRPQDGGVRHSRGMIHMDLGMAASLTGRDPMPHLRAAVADLDLAIGLEPTVADWKRGRADVRFQMGLHATRTGAEALPFFDAARADLEAILVDTSDNSAWHALGNVRRAIAIERNNAGQDGLPDLVAAIEAYDRAVEHSENSALSLTGRGAAWALRGEYEDRAGVDPDVSLAKAIADFDAAIALNPAHAAAYGNRGNVWNARAQAAERRGRDPLPALAKAVADYGAAIERNPTHPGFLGNRAIAWLHTARNQLRLQMDPEAALDGAVADLDRAIAITPDRPNLRWTRCNAHRMRGQWRQRSGGDATSAYEAALADALALRRWWDHRAGLHRETGQLCELLERWADAATAYERALALRPDDPETRERLAVVRGR